MKPKVTVVLHDWPKKNKYSWKGKWIKILIIWTAKHFAQVLIAWIPCDHTHVSSYLFIAIGQQYLQTFWTDDNLKGRFFKSRGRDVKSHIIWKSKYVTKIFSPLDRNDKRRTFKLQTVWSASDSASVPARTMIVTIRLSRSKKKGKSDQCKNII